MYPVWQNHTHKLALGRTPSRTFIHGGVVMACYAVEGALG